MDDDRIKQALERFWQGLSEGDLSKTADGWEVPGLVLSDEGAIRVTDNVQIEKFFSQASEWYRSRGLVSTKPEVERIVPLTDKLTAVDVRRPAFDEPEERRSPPSDRTTSCDWGTTASSASRSR